MTSRLFIDHALCALMLITLVSSRAAADPVTPVDKEFAYLNSAMDRYSKQLWIYDGADCPGNRYFPSYIWNNSVGTATALVDSDCTIDPYPGNKTCLSITFTGQLGADGKTSGNAVAFQESPTWNGKLAGDNSGLPDAGVGYDLSGATRLHGFIRCDRPCTDIELSVGAANDTLSFFPLIRPKLDTKWQAFEIDLAGATPKYVPMVVATGLTVKYFGSNRSTKGCTVYLGDVEFDKAILEQPRLIQSFEPHPLRDDQQTRMAAYIYDNSCAILAYLARGTVDDRRRARILANAFVYAQNHDPAITDGRLRNAYAAGAIYDHFGEPARLPGWWVSSGASGTFEQDYGQISTSAGNEAWAMLALIQCSIATKDDPTDPNAANDSTNYLYAAEKLGDWVYKVCGKADYWPIGYTGGFNGWPPFDSTKPESQTPALYVATEHNIDLIAAYARIFLVTKDRKFLNYAENARQFVNDMFIDGHYATGTIDLGPRLVDYPSGSIKLNTNGGIPKYLINLSNEPCDVNLWSTLVLGNTPATESAVAWALNHCIHYASATDPYVGFSFKGDMAIGETPDQFAQCAEGLPNVTMDDSRIHTANDGVWWEGTGQAVTCLQMSDFPMNIVQLKGDLLRSCQIPADLAGAFLAQMELAQSSDSTIEQSPVHGFGLDAASVDCLNTGFLTTIFANEKLSQTPWVYYKTVGLAPSCWQIFAELHYNPYWGIKTSDPIPDWEH